MTQVLKNKKGVTLVELLAVIVIMGIIAAIAVPAIGGLINSSQERAAEATFDSIQEASRLKATAEREVNEDVIFTLASLDSEDYLDLTGVTTTNIWVKVSGTTVTFWGEATADTTSITTLTIDTYTINVSTGKVS
ncbi:MAG: prepilin-type N-terminal cleavage/methylation domain-containing protein [Acholeplasmataceae bacterium]|nr:prepilin-type N-terminal cleavage/methylation domain-containing protein [Acholeplasmataceae bacterium]